MFTAKHSCYFIFLYFHTHTSSKPTVTSFNRSNQITRMQKPKSRRRWEAEGLWKEKSAGLEEFEPKLTSQRKFPRESSLLLLPTHLKFLHVLAKKKSLQLNSRTDTLKKALTINPRYRKIIITGGFKRESS